MYAKHGKCVTAKRIHQDIWRYFQVKSLTCCGAYEIQNSLLVSKGLKLKPPVIFLILFILNYPSGLKLLCRLNKNFIVVCSHLSFNMVNNLKYLIFFHTNFSLILCMVFSYFQGSLILPPPTEMQIPSIYSDDSLSIL